MRVLVVEDDPMIGRAVADGLQGEGYAVDWVRDGTAARARALPLPLRPRGARPRPAAQGRLRRAEEPAARAHRQLVLWLTGTLKAIVERHRGVLVLGEAHPGRRPPGLAVHVRLPLEQAA